MRHYRTVAIFFFNPLDKELRVEKMYSCGLEFNVKPFKKHYGMNIINASVKKKLTFYNFIIT